MRIKNIATPCLIALLTFQLAFAQEETIASRPDVTFREVFAQIEKLIRTGTEEAIDQLRSEASELEKRDDEDFQALAAFMYERFFEDSEKAQEIRNRIEQEFPKGKFARAREFRKLFSEDGLSATEMDQRYQVILQEFPKENFQENELEIYDHASLKLVIKFAEEGNTDKAIDPLRALEESKYYPIGVISIYEHLLDSDKKQSMLPFVEKAYQKALTAYSSDDERARPSDEAQLFDLISATYADVLLQSGRLEEALETATTRLDKSFDEEIYVYSYLNTAISVLEKQNKKEDAIALLEKHLPFIDETAEIDETYKRLYKDVHGTDADPETALQKIKEEAKQMILAQYEQEMIKEEAPAFTLLDMDGKTASLSDYRGKVVVLDFWATWCGPCIMSFPGMQTAVNKYADDPDVEFLFINTQEREANYKELVEQFLTTNDYNFHVLFDEMHDLSKATASAYGVRGFPTKIVIDKEGFIRFRSTGLERDIDKAVGEMTAKIELAKKG